MKFIKIGLGLTVAMLMSAGAALAAELSNGNLDAVKALVDTDKGTCICDNKCLVKNVSFNDNKETNCKDVCKQYGHDEARGPMVGAWMYSGAPSKECAAVAHLIRGGPAPRPPVVVSIESKDFTKPLTKEIDVISGDSFAVVLPIMAGGLYVQDTWQHKISDGTLIKSLGKQIEPSQGFVGGAKEKHMFTTTGGAIVTGKATITFAKGDKTVVVDVNVKPEMAAEEERDVAMQGGTATASAFNMK